MTITMKKVILKEFTVEYRGYKLNVTIEDSGLNSVKKYFYIEGICNELDSFVKSGHYENYLPIMEEFMKYADVVIQNKK